MSGHAQILVWVTLAMVAAAPLRAQAAPSDWIAREKIRAGWVYYGDGADRLQFFKQQGMNALVTSAGNPETFGQWAQEARRAGMHLFGVLGFSYDAEEAGMRRAVFGNGYESVVACPTDERFWEERMIQPAVRLAKEGMSPDKDISGILIDFELYANEGKGGQLYYTDACYCDHCFGEFLKHKGLEDITQQLPLAQRTAWLKDKGLYDEYHPFLQQRVRALADKMRQAVEQVRPDFFIGFYPIPHNWMLVGVAQGLGTPQHPMILWATSTYGGGGPKAIPDNWRDEMDKQGIHCYHAAGMLLRFYSAANLAANMVGVSLKTDGYWLFTVHTLCLREDEQNGDYYLAAGSPQDYLREIKRANDELDECCADPAYQSALQFVDEPVRYRQVGYDISRLKVPALVDASPSPRGQAIAVEPFPLIGGNFLMAVLQAGEEATFRLATDRTASGDVWGVSYAVVDADKQIVSEGKLPPGEESVVQFRAEKAGVHTVVLTAGYYGRCQVLSSTVPFALWTGDRFEVSQPGGTLYFVVPEGLEEFTLKAQCLWGTSAAKLTVSGPDGALVTEQETDPFVRSVDMTVPTDGKAGLWSLKVAGLPGKSYRSLSLHFDSRLPQVATLAPTWVLTEAPK